MTEQQKKDVRAQTQKNEEEFKRRLAAEQEDHKNRVKLFSQNLEDSTREFDALNRAAKEKTVDHLNAISRLKAQEDDRIRLQNAVHSENLKESRKAAARNFDEFRSAIEISEQNIISHQSDEKGRMEEERRQLNSEITERLKIELEESSRTREMADQQEKERIESKNALENKNFGEIKEMKNVLAALSKENDELKITHENTMADLSKVSLVSQLRMEKAQSEMKDKRRKNESLEVAADEINTLVRKFNEVSAKIGVATRLKKPALLKKQAVGVSHAMERIKATKSEILRILDDLIQTQIDDKDDERNGIFSTIKEDLGKLDNFHEEITQLAIPTPGDDDYLPLEDIAQSLENATEVINSIKSNWQMVPPMDKTNLVHAQLMASTNLLLNGGCLSVEAAQLKELEDEVSKKDGNSRDLPPNGDDENSQ